MLDDIEKAPRAGGAFSELPLHDGAGKPEIKPPRQNTQIKFQDLAEAEFDAEIALALAASHWRTVALFLNLTVQYAEAGDYLSLDRNRRQAREQFLEGNSGYKHFQRARGGAAAWIGAEAFLEGAPMTAPVILNFKLLDKNTLGAVFDIQLSSGMVICRAMLHTKNDRWWIGLPGKPYTKPDGSQSWSKVLDFRDKPTHDRFQQTVTPLARAAYEQSQARGAA
jgi:hypothetical protein